MASNGRSIARVLAWSAAGAFLTACGGSGPETLNKSGPGLSPGDFVDHTVEVVENADHAPSLAVVPSMVTGPIGASGGVLDVTAEAGRPGDLTGAAGKQRPVRTDGVPAPAAIPGAIGAASQKIGAASLVDVKVGDINGKPVYANTFLDDMADQLVAETARQSHDQWLGFTKVRIEDKLDLQIRDELLRAEAMANLTPEQKQNFFAFMEGVQRRVESQNQGSRSATDARLEATEGMSLDQYMKKREQEELIGLQLREKIDKRVSIPWRDIKQEYDRYFDTFNPAPKARFRMVQVPKDKPEDIAAVEKARADGVPFEELAANKKINRYKPDAGGAEEREFKGERSTATLLKDPELNKAAQTMAVGEVKGPITVGDNQAWLYLESIVAKGKSLYEAQLDIESVLRRRRTADATDRYIKHLRERASISSTDEMTGQLLAVADRRFWPAGKK